MKLVSNSPLSKQVDLYAAEKYAYYNQWMFDEPIFISRKEDEEIQALQKVLFKVINYFIENYDKWSHLMPLNVESRRVFDAFKDRPYASGSYRVDTVFVPLMVSLLPVTQISFPERINQSPLTVPRRLIVMLLSCSI